MELSKKHNPNYVASVVRIEKIRPHSNADRLQIATIDFQDVVVGNNIKIGDVGVYFPVESAINYEVLSMLNAFRDKTKNKNQEVAGFFESNCRVRAVKLRGEKSCGWFVKWEVFANALSIAHEPVVGTQFDKVSDIVIVKKYFIPLATTESNKKDKPVSTSILVDNQVRLHVDTENLRRNIQKINVDDLISVTYKYHGTSWWTGNLLTYRPLNFIERLLKRLGVKLSITQYKLIYGSRKVIKNDNSSGYYQSDLWKSIADKIGSLPEGYTLYGEAVGFTDKGEAIQKDYDYGCVKGEFDLYVYRITFTNPSGFVTELSWSQIKEFCKRYDLYVPEEYFYGKAWDHFVELYNRYSKENKKTFAPTKIKDLNNRDFYEYYIPLLEHYYTEQRCHICKNDVPAEGIVLRVDRLFECLPYKLKSFAFLERETKSLDKGESNIEG